MSSRKKNSFRCTLCGNVMRRNIGDRRPLPFVVREEYPFICSDCAEDLALDCADLQYVFNDPASISQSSTSKPKTGEKEHAKQINPETAAADTRVNYNNLVSKIKNVVCSQDRQVERLCLAVVRKQRSKDDKERANILIIGDTGSGKTLMIQQLAKVTNKVVVYEDATTYTEEGYVGDSVRDMLKHLLDAAGGNVEKAQQGIIFLDEVDKKRASTENGVRDVSGSKVLESMLIMMDGSKIYVPRKGGLPDILFDTSKLIFVFSGSFSGIEKIREKRLKKKGNIGFCVSSEEKSPIDNTEYMPEDLLEFGIPKEFIGRCKTIIEMNKLTVPDLVNIMKRSADSAVKAEKAEFKSMNVELVIPDEVYKEIAEAAVALQTGARAIAFIVSKITEPIWQDLLSGKCKVSKCILHEGIITKPGNYEFV